jgi:hypothetical protein
MDQLEERIAERLRASTGENGPSADLATRIVGVVRSRRRRRQRVATVAAALTAVAIAVPVGLVLRGGPSAAPAAPAPSASLSSPPAPKEPDLLGAPRAPGALDVLVNRPSAMTSPLRLTPTLMFRADALGPTGILLGGTGFDGDPYRATDGRVWFTDPRTGRATALSKNGEAWGHAVGNHVLVWLEHRDEQHDYQLICADRSTGRPPVQISDGGVAKSSGPVQVDNDRLAWTDEADQTWVVRGCTGTPKRLPISGLVVGFTYPDAFVVDRRDNALRAVNVETNAYAPVAGTPVFRWDLDTTLQFAASAHLFAWISQSRLTIVERGTGHTRTITSLPGDGDLAVGNRLVVYSHRPFDANPATSTAVVYDSVTGQQVALASEALISHDLLTWREGANYVVARVRP